VRAGENTRLEDGIILETLPRGLYRVRTDDGRRVVVSLGGVTRQVTVRVIPGDRVRVELSPFDPTRGKIVARLG
jgi:translation initiation factor IF-1